MKKKYEQMSEAGFRHSTIVKKLDYLVYKNPHLGKPIAQFDQDP